MADALFHHYIDLPFCLGSIPVKPGVGCHAGVRGELALNFGHVLLKLPPMWLIRWVFSTQALGVFCLLRMSLTHDANIVALLASTP